MSRPSSPTRASADSRHTCADSRAAVLKAQEPGPRHGVASGHWLASSRSTISSSYWIDRTAGRGGIGAGAALAAIVDDLAGLRAIAQGFEGDRGVNSVPPLFMKAIAERISRFLRSESPL